MIKYNKFTEKFEILNASMLSFLTLPSNQIKNMYFSNRFIEIDKDLVYIITKDYLPYYENLEFYSRSRDEVNIIDDINEDNKEILFPVSEFNGVDGVIALQTPLPHLGVGFDAQGNKIDLAVTGGVTEGFDKDGSKWLHEKGCVKTPDIIPNNQFKQSVAIGVNVPPTAFLNASPCKIDFTGLAYMNKSNVLIWKQAVRDSLNFDSSNSFLWGISEIDQQYIYDNVQDDYRYLFWVKKTGELIKDIFLYSNEPSTGSINQLQKYVGVSET